MDRRLSCFAELVWVKHRVGAGLDVSGCYLQDFNALSPPFAATILLGGDSNLLAGGDAFHTALAVFDYRHIFTENDFGVRNLDPAQHVVAPLNEDPTGDQWLP